MTITTHRQKGSALTWNELDNNFEELASGQAQIGGSLAEIDAAVAATEANATAAGEARDQAVAAAAIYDDMNAAFVAQAIAVDALAAEVIELGTNLDGKVDDAALLAGGGAELMGAELKATAGSKYETAQERFDKVLFLSSFDDSVAAAVQFQNAINKAVAANRELLLDQNLSLAASVNCPAGLRLRGAGGIITQTANLTPIFVCDGAGRREFRQVQCRGKQTDYVNNSGVYAAACVDARNGATVDVDESCEFLNFAGAGVRLLVGSVNCRIKNSTISGAGPTYITSTTFNYGGCVVVDNGVLDWSVESCDLSAAAQGIVTGDSQANVRVLHNYIHDIPGQHGAYIESTGSLLVEGNIFESCGLCGMKVQIGTTLAPDAKRIVIQGNAFSEIGAQAVLITNPVGGAPRIRELIIANNVAANAVAGGNAAYHLVFVIGARVHGNISQRFQRGVHLDTCGELDVTHNRLSNCLDEGIFANGLVDSNIAHNAILSPGGSNNSATAWGINLAGATSARLTVDTNYVNDTGAKMRAAFYSSAGDQATYYCEGNYFLGGTQYGARLDAAKPIGRWQNNVVQGLLAPFLNFPAGFTTLGGVSQVYASAAAPVSGIYLLGDRIEVVTPVVGQSMGWLVTTAGGGVTGTWASGVAYTAGTWYRNSSGRVYRLVTAGGGNTSVQPVGTTLGATETGADGYVWMSMILTTAVFAPLPRLGAAVPTLTGTATLTTLSAFTQLADATAGTFAVNLPTAASASGMVFNIKKIDSSANAVTIDGNGAETIDGALTFALTVQWQSVQVQSNGTAWYIL